MATARPTPSTASASTWARNGCWCCPMPTGRSSTLSPKGARRARPTPWRSSTQPSSMACNASRQATGDRLPSGLSPAACRLPPAACRLSPVACRLLRDVGDILGELVVDVGGAAAGAGAHACREIGGKAWTQVGATVARGQSDGAVSVRQRDTRLQAIEIVEEPGATHEHRLPHELHLQQPAQAQLV